MATRDKLASSAEVAEYLDVSVKTLDQWAHKGEGPTYTRVGKYRRYEWADVKAWFRKQPKGGEGAT